MHQLQIPQCGKGKIMTSDTLKELFVLLYVVKYLADIFDKLQCRVVEGQVGSRQDGEHL